MLRNLYWLAALAMLVAAPAFADESTSEKKSTADLIKQLDAEDFSERQAASEKLAERGKEAIDALIEAAQGESAEATSRSLDILRKHAESTNDELKTAATAALQKLSEGEGAAARRAKEILTPKPKPPAEVRTVPGAPGIRIAPGAIRIAVAAGGGGKRISIKDVNGVKEIEVVEADRTTKIDDDPAKGIKVKVTEKKDGKEETKEYEAKNAEELKEKHPEAHKLYEQYGKGGGEIRLEGIRIAPAAVPGIRRIDRPVIIREPREVTDRLDKANKQLDETTAKLKKLIESADNADELRAAIEAIEATKKELDEVKAQFPAR